MLGIGILSLIFIISLLWVVLILRNPSFIHTPNHSAPTKTKIEMLATKKALEKNSVYPRRYFYPSLNKLPFLHSANECMVSEDISQRILCLPSYDDLTENEIKKIVMIISESLT